MRSRRAATTVLLVGVIGLAGCGRAASGGGSTTSTAAGGHGLTGTAWILGSFRGAGGATTPAAPGATADLAFEAGGALVGSSGCNRFTGTYVATATSLTVTPGPTTLIACTSAALTAQEATLFQLLPQVKGYTRSSDRLTLTGAGGTTLVTYTAGLSGLPGTSWSASGVNNGNGGVESTAATELLTASFGSDGAFSGFGGCNTFSGTYRTTGKAGLTITGLASTLKSCSPEVDALESQYSAALGKVASYAISGDDLTLRNAAGETQVTYRLAG